MVDRTPVTFANRDGARLFGILEVPKRRPAASLGVLLLSPGVKMRVGPQGLYRRMAEGFARAGLPVFRFDPFGLGDSEGAHQDELIRELYNRIELGRNVDDSIDAMDWMERQCGMRRFILAGLCGGAVTGLLAGARDRRAAGLMAVGITPVLSAGSAEASAFMTSGQLTSSRQRYLNRLRSPRAWLRLLTLQADNRLIRRMAADWLRRRFGRGRGAEPAPPQGADNTNPLFAPAFIELLSARRPMLFVFGGEDRLRWEFEEKFEARQEDRLASLGRNYDVHVVPAANHVLSWTDSQDEMLARLAQWLDANFAADLVPAPADAAPQLSPAALIER